MFERVNVYLNEPIKIDKLINLANQSIMSTLAIETFWKQKVCRLKHRKQKKKLKMLGFDLRKRHIKGEKHIAQMENPIFWTTTKFIMVDFCEMDFSKGIAI